MIKNNHTKPFLKWAGGKRSLLPYLLKIAPKDFNNYYEPFLGGGSLFFELHPRKAYLSDLNEELINSYKQIKQNVTEVIKFLRTMKYDKASYYKIRSMDTKNDFKRAARFIYLNKTCWNGLYRVNKNNLFNVPMGRYKIPTICDEQHLTSVSKALKSAVIRTADFEFAVNSIKENDLIYFDPPYVTSHKNNGFISYNSKLFSIKDQERLREAMFYCIKKGCKVMLSNANHQFIRELYKNLKIRTITRRSIIASKLESRKNVTELIITNF